MKRPASAPRHVAPCLAPMWRLAQCVLLTSVFCLAGMRAVAAQRLVVRVTHHPAPSKSELDASAYYWRPGAADRDSIRGLPSATVFQEVAPGDQVCYRIDRANPLLYSYALAAVDVPVAPAADLDKFVSQIEALIKGAKVAVATPGAKVDSLALFRERVRQLAVTDLRKSNAIRQGSDTATFFGSVVERDAELWEAATKTSAEAESIYKYLGDAGRDSVADLKALQELALAQLRAAHQRVAAAAESMMPADAGINAIRTLQLCKPMLQGRTRFGVMIKPRTDGPPTSTGRRVTGEKEELAAITIDPRYVERFRLAAGLFVAGGFSGDRNVGVADGKLTIAPSDQTYTRTGMFAMARATDFLWPSIAVAKGDGSSVDLFLGMNLRSGNLVFGPEVSIGLGLAWMEVPVGAKSLKAGDAVPNDVKLANIISRERQFGLGVTFTITGLKFNTDTKGEAGTK
jgi:hypothetical protein